jgi:hypothetical protein
MAREARAKKIKDPNKEPGRLKQIWQVFQMTRRQDPSIVWMLALGVLGPLAAGIALAFVLAPWGANPVGFVLYVIIGLFAGILIGIIILGRRAERAAYSQIEGQAGAVGAVLKNGLRRSWVASEMPVNISPKSQDAVYRAVGRGGIVLFGEGPKSRTQRMLEDERRKVARIVPNVPISFIYVGPDADSTPLYKIAGQLRKLKPALRKQEVLTVSNRLQSLGKNLMPIPKGIDPMKVRASRSR